MAACMMFKAEAKSLESDGHVTEEKDSAIDHVSRGRDSSPFSEKSLATSQSQPKKVTPRVRVADLRARCGRHLRGGFEKLEVTEQEVEERQRAMVQKLIAKTLKQTDRRRPQRRRLKILPLRFPRWNVRASSLLPLLSCFRWLRHPFLCLARMASLAASRVEMNRKHHHSSKVRCFPLEETLVPLLSVCEGAC